MKQIEVVAAIIHDNEGRIFATQRGYGDYKAAGKRGLSDACISYAEREQARLNELGTGPCLILRCIVSGVMWRVAR